MRCPVQTTRWRARRTMSKVPIRKHRVTSALRNSDPRNSKLRSSKLRNSKLRNSKLHNSKLHNSKLHNSNLQFGRKTNPHSRGRQFALIAGLTLVAIVTAAGVKVTLDVTKSEQMLRKHQLIKTILPGGEWVCRRETQGQQADAFTLSVNPGVQVVTPSGPIHGAPRLDSTTHGQSSNRAIRFTSALPSCAKTRFHSNGWRIGPTPLNCGRLRSVRNGCSPWTRHATRPT